MSTRLNSSNIGSTSSRNGVGNSFVSLTQNSGQGFSTARTGTLGDSMSEEDIGSGLGLNGNGNAFERDLRDGFTSNNFDISVNIDRNDDRAGLVDTDKDEVRKLMSEGLDFDSARLQLNLERMETAGIDPSTGLPMDSRAVTFESLRSINNSNRRIEILRNDSHRKKIMAVINRIGVSPQRILVISILTLIIYYVMRHTTLFFPDVVDDNTLLNREK